MYSDKSSSNLLRDYFIALYDHRATQLTFKIQTDRFKQKQENLWMRFAVQKWVLRSDQSIIFRQKKRCLDRYRLNKLTLGRCFSKLKKQAKAYSEMKKQLERVFLNNHKIL